MRRHLLDLDLPTGGRRRCPGFVEQGACGLDQGRPAARRRGRRRRVTRVFSVRPAPRSASPARRTASRPRANARSGSKKVSARRVLPGSKRSWVSPPQHWPQRRAEGEAAKVGGRSPVPRAWFWRYGSPRARDCRRRPCRRSSPRSPSIFTPASRGEEPLASAIVTKVAGATGLDCFFERGQPVLHEPAPAMARQAASTRSGCSGSIELRGCDAHRVHFHSQGWRRRR